LVEVVVCPFVLGVDVLKTRRRLAIPKYLPARLVGDPRHDLFT
jgi:hypothetical protein